MFAPPLQRACSGTGLEPWCDALGQIAEEAWQKHSHGDRAQWDAALDRLPDLPSSESCLHQGTVSAVAVSPPTAPQYQHLKEALLELVPWRKGPFRVHGLDIDSEWRSDWKWSRVQPRIAPLKDRLVLDVGCGNGYYGYRMLGDGARAVLGVDPYLLFHYQFRAVQKYLAQPALVHLPIAFEALPGGLAVFDTVFSMGVLYHRRDPQEHLQRLRGCLRDEGELVLETLIVDDQPSLQLQKGQRYARMRNVWWVPNLGDLTDGLVQQGFTDVRIADVTATSPDEQRTTAWMPFESLRESLQADDAGRTVEGFPAPLRAVITARAA